MTKTLLFAIVLCCGTWVVAQTNGSQSDANGQTSNSQTGNSASSNGQANTQENGNAQSGSLKVTGCLKQENGNFAITDYQTGTTYSLYGNGDLSSHVGQAVTVQGMPTGTSEEHSNSPTVGQNASANPFRVQSIQARGECSQTNSK